MLTEQYIDGPHAAAMLGIKPQTLRLWRTLGRGPAWHVLGKRAIVYAIADVEAWAASRQPKEQKNDNV